MPRLGLHWWRSTLLLAGVLFVWGQPLAHGETPGIRVMTFNLWHDGNSGGQPLEQSAAVIKAARADVVGLQETKKNFVKLAELLGWKYFDQGGGTAILSRFPIVAPTPGKWGVKLSLPDGRTAYLFNVHLMHKPYQPYQLLSIPYHDEPFLKGEAAAVDSARQARGNQVKALLAEVAEVREPATPVFITGDFNEPSHLDWTAAAANAGLCPLKVEWPSTKAITDAGFVDGYRSIHPDPVARPGLTWTPTTRRTDPKDHHDRIDFVFGTGPGVKAVAAQIVGESTENADVVVKPYPSDHRTVVVDFELPGAAQ